MICHECKGSEFERQTVELVIRVGEHDVIDRSITVPVCQACGEYVISNAVHEKAELRAALVAFTDAPEVTGSMLRTARKTLGFTQVELGERVGATAESLSRWERSERPMEPWVPLVLLGLIRERLMTRPTDVKLKRAS